MAVSVRLVPHASAAWLEAVALRRVVLRTPLGLDFTAGELALEAGQLHLALRLDGALAGVVVLVPPDRGAAGTWKLRQMAVAAHCRGRGFGPRLVGAAEEAMRARAGRACILHARAGAAPFYARLGWEADGAHFTEIGIAHLHMRKVFAAAHLP